MPRRKRPQPAAGQLTLEQALNRAVQSRELPETDSDPDPDEPVSSSGPSSSEHDDTRDSDWRPPGPKRGAFMDSSDDEEEEETTEFPVASCSRELEHNSEDDDVRGASSSFPRRARVESSDEEESEADDPPIPPPSSSAVGRKRAGKSSHQEDPPSWRDVSDWSPSSLPFTGVAGPSNAASLQSDQPVNFLELFLCEELLLLIVQQTNMYAEQCIAVLHQLRLPFSRVNAWVPLTVVELKRFLGLLFLTGLIKKPSLAEYWSVDVALETPYFRKTMPRNRFQLIWRFIHFSDNREVDGSDPLHKVRLVLDLLLSKFREMYRPSQNISLDEGMLLWRGRLRFKVYNPAKPVKYGIKSYILCDSDNGYCYSMKPYCGIGSTLQNTVRFLVDGLEGFGHRLWMDNFYNSESMCRLLLSLHINSAGTLRVNRGEPPSIRQVSMSDLAVGERRALHNDAVMVLAWRDKRIVRMISTFHTDEMRTVEVRQKGQGERVSQTKPACVVEYNQYMNGVDRLDQKISYYPFIRKTAKWSSKFVAYLMEIAMSNAFIIFRKCNPTASCKTLKDFTLSVIKSWTEASVPPPPPPPAADDQPPPRQATPIHLRKRSASARLSVDFDGHVPLPVEVPPTKDKAYRRCAHCAAKGQRKETKYVCPKCDYLPLCLYPCYFEYHAQ